MRQCVCETRTGGGAAQRWRCFSPRPESGRGLPQSNTLRLGWRSGRRVRVLDCASPLALWLATVQAVLRHLIRLGVTKSTTGRTNHWPRCGTSDRERASLQRSGRRRPASVCAATVMLKRAGLPFTPGNSRRTRQAASGAVDEGVSHGFRRGSGEMGAASKVMPPLAGELCPSLVGQRCGLESLPGGFVGHFGGGQLAELVVTQRQEPFGGFGFTRLHTIQEERDVAHGPKASGCKWMSMLEKSPLPKGEARLHQCAE